jgi:hypothetical protein
VSKQSFVIHSTTEGRVYLTHTATLTFKSWNGDISGRTGTTTTVSSEMQQTCVVGGMRF